MPILNDKYYRTACHSPLLKKQRSHFRPFRKSTQIYSQGVLYYRHVVHRYPEFSKIQPTTPHAINYQLQSFPIHLTQNKYDRSSNNQPQTAKHI